MLLLLFLPLLTVSVAFFPHGIENYPTFGLLDLDSEAAPGSPLTGRSGTARPQSRVCLTESCVETAARLIRQTDRTKDPCEDFYQFACGGFVADTVLPDHKTRLGSYDLLRDELNIKLKALFEAESDESEPRIYQGEIVADNFDTNLSM